MLPSAGLGAVSAIQDAVILSNCIYDMDNTSLEQITAAFADYKEQRYPHAKEAVISSANIGTLLYGQKWYERLLRKAILGWMPKWMEQNNLSKTYAYQPQVTFLPRVPVKGSVQVLPQKMSKRYKNPEGANFV